MSLNYRKIIKQGIKNSPWDWEKITGQNLLLIEYTRKCCDSCLFWEKGPNSVECSLTWWINSFNYHCENYDWGSWEPIHVLF